MNKIGYLVIHHSWSQDRGVLDWSAIRRYHIEENGWADVAYHYGIEIVGNDWVIVTGRAEDVTGAHCVEQGMNRKSLAICMIGNFDLVPPHPRSLDLLATLCTGLCHKYDLTPDKIVPHRQFATYKTCPGKMFPMDELRKRIK
jgi:N-acetylmuramoyl-L-alanine amidase